MFNRFFHSSIDEGTKRQIHDFMGFGNVRYRFGEALGTVLLRAWDMEGCIGNENFRTMTKDEWMRESVNPSVLVSHEAPLLEVEHSKVESLVPQILPSPLRLLLGPKIGTSNYRIEPRDFEASLIALKEELEKLDARIRERELGVILLRRGEEKLSLLFQFRRKRLFNACIAKGLDSLWNEQVIQNDTLIKLFGTTATVVRIECPPKSLESGGLTKATIALKQAFWAETHWNQPPASDERPAVEIGL